MNSLRFVRFLSPFLLLFLAPILPAREVPVGVPERVSAAGQRGYAVVASDGKDFLVAWHDQRGNVPSIRVTRVSSAGEVLDPLGIVLARNTGGTPLVAWVRDAYVLLWNGGGDNQPAVVVAARIGRDGTLLTPPHVIASGSMVTQRAMATNGTTVVAAYLGNGLPFSTVRAVTLDAETNVLADHALSSSDMGRWDTVVASNGEQYLAVWNAFPNLGVWPNGTLEAVRLDAQGTPLDAAPRTLGAGVDPEIASNGANYVVAAKQKQSNTTVLWTSRFVAGDLSSVSAPAVLPGAEQFYDSTLMRVSNRYLFLAGAVSRVAAVAIDDAGAPVNGARDLQATQILGAPFAATNGTSLLAVCSEFSEPGQMRLFAQLFDPSSLAPQNAPQSVAMSANKQSSPAIASSGGQQLVVWTERSGVWATRIAGGVSLDGRGVQLGTRANVSPPRVVFDGEQYVVAWAEVPDDYETITDHGVVVRTITPAGAVSDPIRIVSFAWSVDLATNGPATMLVWVNNITITAARFDRATRTLSAPLALSLPDRYGVDPAIAWNGREFLAAWGETRADELPPFHPNWSMPPRVMGTRITESLAILDPQMLTLADVPLRDDGRPALASDGRDWMLAWISDEVVQARRIAADGTPQEVSVISSSPAFTTPAVEWDGVRYAFAWKEANVVKLAYLGGIEISAPNAEYDYDTVDLVRAGYGIALVYARRADEAPYGGVSRAFVQFFGRKSRAVR